MIAVFHQKVLFKEAQLLCLAASLIHLMFSTLSTATQLRTYHNNSCEIMNRCGFGNCPKFITKQQTIYQLYSEPNYRLCPHIFFCYFLSSHQLLLNLSMEMGTHNIIWTSTVMLIYKLCNIYHLQFHRRQINITYKDNNLNLTKKEITTSKIPILVFFIKTCYCKYTHHSYTVYKMELALLMYI